MPFRWKIVLGVVVIQAAVLVILIWNGMNVLKQSNEAALLKRTDTTAKLFASTAQAAVLASDLATLESYVGEVLSNPDIVYTRVLSKQGVLAESGKTQLLARKFVADTSLASTANDQVFDAYADITVSGEKYGRVEVGFSTTEIQKLITNSCAEPPRGRIVFLGAGELLDAGFECITARHEANCHGLFWLSDPSTWEG